MDSTVLNALREAFGEGLQVNAPLAAYTSARVGGAADALLIARSVEELTAIATQLWAMDVPFRVLGGGSNVLVSDRGVRGVVVLNRAQRMVLHLETEPPTIWAESGASLNSIVQRAARAGLSGLEWAAGIPGTLGGAIYGNAGAFGGEMAQSVQAVDILHRQHGKQCWDATQFAFSYRSSLLKRGEAEAVILAATLQFQREEMTTIQNRMAHLNRRRKQTQPPGASMGSVFKNPPGDYAGRLIEAAGLKGTRIGDVEVSPIHANFFINRGQATASDIKALIDLVQRAVAEKSGVVLEPEIEFIGEWPS